MISRHFLLVVFTLLLSSEAFSEGQNNLVDVKTDLTEDIFTADFQFQKPIRNDKLTVDFINETIQLNFPEVQVPDGKKTFSVKKGQVKSVYVYAPSVSNLRARVILEGVKAAEHKDNIDLVSTENGMKMIWFKNGRVKQAEESIALTKPQSFEESTALIAEAEQLVLSEEQKNSMPETEIPLAVAKKEKIEEKSDPIQRAIVGLIAFGVFGVILLVAIGRYQKRSQLANKYTAIKVLGQHHIAPKKSLMIIQVAGETILIGVTDHSINPIKTLSLLDEEVPELSGQDDFDRKLNLDDEEFSFKGIRDLVTKRVNKLKDFNA